MIINMVSERSVSGGVQKIYKFNNGYGASVIKNDYSYGGREGKWELAVIAFDGDDWAITYDTPITSDVIGHIVEEDLEDILKEIQSL